MTSEQSANKPSDIRGAAPGDYWKAFEEKWTSLLTYRYLGRDDQVNIATSHPEFSHWRWIKADEMVASIVPFKRAVYEEVVRSFRAYLA